MGKVSTLPLPFLLVVPAIGSLSLHERDETQPKVLQLLYNESHERGTHLLEECH